MLDLRPLTPGEADELGQAPLRRRLGCRRPAAARELTKGQSLIPNTEPRDLAQRLGEISERAAALEALHGLDLLLRGAIRSHEVRVVGVREPVRARLRRSDDRALLEGE